MKLLVLCSLIGLVSAFTPPATLQPASRVVVSTSGVAMAAKKKASPTRPEVGKRAQPLSPGSNYPSTKNIQTQSNGFGTFVQKFQLAKGKSKYGVPIFLPNGNVNPAYALRLNFHTVAAHSPDGIACHVPCGGFTRCSGHGVAPPPPAASPPKPPKRHGQLSPRRNRAHRD